MNAAGNRAVGQPQTQRLQAQVAPFEEHVGGEVADGERAAVLNAASFKAHIGIHHLPLIGFKAVIRQHFSGRLRGGLAFAPFGLAAFTAGVDANQRPQIRQP